MDIVIYYLCNSAWHTRADSVPGGVAGMFIGALAFGCRDE